MDGRRVLQRPATLVPPVLAAGVCRWRAGIQMSHWDELKPVDDRCLTQLGGCAVVGPGGAPLFSWVDEGLCDLPDFEEMLESTNFFLADSTMLSSNVAS